METRKLAPIHPGEILLEEFMKPLGLSQNGLARTLRVPPRRINEVVLGLRGLSVAGYELRLARRSAEARIARDVRPLARAAWPTEDSRAPGKLRTLRACGSGFSLAFWF
jgi:addiction module HigA family antidote